MLDMVGWGFFYKNSLPVIVRNDLSFAESIVIEIKFGRKIIFFTVLYRSLASNHTSLEFQAFLSNFKKLHSHIQAENPFATSFAGDFNAHSQLWWPDGDTNPEGMEIENLFTSLSLSQVISEPTDFEPNKSPSCIDLIATDQPNLILDCGTRASLDTFCHHQIIYCKVHLKIPPPPPFERNIWHFNRANTAAIKRSMTSFPWLQHLNINIGPNWQVKTFTEIFLNIMSNYIPNENKKFVPRDPPWITKPLKTMLNRKNRLFKNYKKHRYKEEDKVRLEVFRKECQEAVESAKLSYLTNMGNKVRRGPLLPAATKSLPNKSLSAFCETTSSDFDTLYFIGLFNDAKVSTLSLGRVAQKSLSPTTLLLNQFFNSSCSICFAFKSFSDVGCPSTTPVTTLNNGVTSFLLASIMNGLKFLSLITFKISAVILLVFSVSFFFFKVSSFKCLEGTENKFDLTALRKCDVRVHFSTVTSS